MRLKFFKFFANKVRNCIKEKFALFQKCRKVNIFLFRIFLIDWVTFFNY